MPHNLNFYAIQRKACANRENNLHRQDLTADYKFFRNKSGYTNIVSNTLPENKTLLPLEYHISFHPKDMEKAFRIATNYLLKLENSNFYFSVADPNVSCAPGTTRHQMTLYLFSDEEGHFLHDQDVLNAYLNKLEQKFIEAGVQPNPKVNPEELIPNSSYIRACYIETTPTLTNTL